MSTHWPPVIGSGPRPSQARSEVSWTDQSVTFWENWIMTKAQRFTGSSLLLPICVQKCMV